ncbi:MAG: SusC/RagA family TonB-linked outer membrane protein, partial [Bacteroidota bacterium]
MKRKLLPQIIAMSRHLIIGLWVHCMLASFVLAHEGNAQNNRLKTVEVKVDWKDISLENALEEIEAQTEFHFTYDKNLVSDLKLNKQKGRFTLANLLEKISRKTQLKFTRIQNNIFVDLKDEHKLSTINSRFPHGSLSSPSLRMIKSGVTLLDLDNILFLDHQVSGNVKDESGNPLEGASVVVKGTQIGVLTDARGDYSINVENGNVTLSFSYVGYETQEVAVNGRNTLNINLREKETALDEVIVVGYGTQGKGTITSAIEKIDGDEINTIPVVSPTQAIQGRAAGVVITNQGAPGQDPVIRIRGLTTPNNNNPLIVIDGIPAGGLSSINSNDVESIEILKDASAASIYGSRAAGGVILITTKRGKSGAPSINFDTYVGTQIAANTLNLLNTDQYIDVMTDQQQNGGLPIPPRFDDASIRNTDIDWQDEVFDPGLIQNYNLGVSGGSESARYLFSLNYLNQEGIVTNNDFERYSARINSDFTFWNRFRVGQNLVLAFTQSNNVRNQGGRGLFEHVTKMAPYLAVRDAENPGGFNGPDQIDNNDAENPVRVLLLGENKSRTLKALGNAFAEVDIVKGLTARTSIGLDAAFGRSFSFLPAFQDGDFHMQEFASLSENRSTFFSPVWTNTLSYNEDFGGHNLG